MTTLIAEIGINHNGSLEIAKSLIDMAVQCKCDFVKFQKRTIETVYSAEELGRYRESPWGETQRDQKEGLELGKTEYDAIDAYCKSVGIKWFASAWDIESQDFLSQYDLEVNKVASAMTTNLGFIRRVASEQKYTYVSTGMCSIDDIDRAVRIFQDESCPFCLMHSVSLYPAEESQLNLRNIEMLRERYSCDVGYSGHEKTVSPSVMAACLGAVAIERHITLDRAMYGSDQSASLEGPGLRSLGEQLRKLPIVLGSADRLVIPGEAEVAKKLRYWQ